jgi:2-oxoglutarate dehydrogenase E2 component (dihydrolipoamide succinyltransferase)
MKPVMDLRTRYQEDFQKQYGVKLGLMSFFARASLEALKKFPAINASIDGTDVIYHGYFDIGIAVSTDRGLIVPVLHDADQMTFADIEKKIRDFGERAGAGKLGIEELLGGTFTITNGGIFGSLLSTPILNPPQSAILGMHKIEERPIVENGEIIARPMMYVALSYDHRIIDGHEAVLFLKAIKETLEDPSRMLIGI